MEYSRTVKNPFTIGTLQSLALCSLAISCPNDSNSSKREDIETAIGMKMVGEAKGLADTSQLKAPFNLPVLTKLLDGRDPIDRSELVIMQFESPDGSPFGLQRRHQHEDFVVTGIFDGSTGIPKCVFGSLRREDRSSMRQIDLSIHKLSLQGEYFGESAVSPKVSFIHALNRVAVAGDFREIHEVAGIYYQRPAHMGVNQNEGRIPFWGIFVVGDSASRPFVRKGYDREKMIFLYSVNAISGEIANHGFAAPRVID